MKTITKYFVWLSCVLCLILSSLLPAWVVLADEEEVNFEIMPQVDPARLQQINKAVLEANGNIWDIYNAQAETLSTDEQVASGVMTRDTLINYAIKLLRFLSQLGLLIGGAMILLTWWKYIMAVISGDSPPSLGTALGGVAKGIAVIAGSAAILKVLQWAFLA